MKYQKVFIAESPHLCHPSFNPKSVYIAVDETDTGDVPEPPKPVVVDDTQAQIAALQEQLAALVAAQKK